MTTDDFEMRYNYQHNAPGENMYFSPISFVDDDNNNPDQRYWIYHFRGDYKRDEQDYKHNLEAQRLRAERDKLFKND